MFALLFVAACSPDYVTGDWPTDMSRAQSRPEQVAALEDYMFTLTGQPSERKGIRTNALLIAQKGVVVYERYARGFDASKRQLSWSVAKSIASVLTGRLVQLGANILDRSVRSFNAAWLIDERVTVRHLLEFSSGLDWREIYENASNQESSTLALLYGVGRHDRATFVANHKQAYDPGTHFEYSTGNAMLLMQVLRLHRNGDEQWPWTELFLPIGMTSAVFEKDQAGAFSGGSSFYATPRDYLKFGALALQQGCYAEQQLLPLDWMQQSTTISQAYFDTAETNLGGTQGWQWWANKIRPGVDASLPWPSLPDDAYAARGYWGQYIVVIPSLDMIIVRNGDDREAGAVDDDRFFSLALAVGRAP